MRWLQSTILLREMQESSSTRTFLSRSSVLSFCGCNTEAKAESRQSAVVIATRPDSDIEQIHRKLVNHPSQFQNAVRISSARTMKRFP
jgi:hypothetical protein